MNRINLHRLAEDRILDVHALLAAQRWTGAHHLAGYAVECGLKSCVLALVEYRDDLSGQDLSEAAGRLLDARP